MQELPFEIPQSLRSYVAQFKNDPEKGIANLESFLKKRGMDAVGFFLLSWLYINKGEKEQAVHYALKAKCFAPGSAFFQHLHYFIAHPDHFEAWKPFEPEVDDTGEPEPETETEAESRPDAELESQEAPALQLDNLIEELSDAEKKKITLISDGHDDRDLGEKSRKVGDIASETLAKIYEKQKKYPDALRTLNNLCKTRPEKAIYYNEEILRIRALMAKEDPESLEG